MLFLLKRAPSFMSARLTKDKFSSIRLASLPNAHRGEQHSLQIRWNSAGPSARSVVHNVILRDYQQECIQSVLDHYSRGNTRLGVSLATGSGKTVIFTQLIDRVPPRDNATKTLILAHRRELVEQAARHCQLSYPDKSIQVEMAASHASGEADITVASIQSITSTGRLNKFDPLKFKLLIVDEAHHITAARYLKVLDHFNVRTNNKSADAPLLVGVSATFARHDGVRLGSCIDHIVYHRDYVDMIRSKWLCDVRFTTVNFQIDLSNVQMGKNGDFNPSALSRAVNTPQSNEVTVRSWLARARQTDQPRKSTIVFCADVGHVEALTSLFRQHGVDARYVTGNTPVRVRADRVDAFRRGEFPVMVNCGVFSEGTDISNIDCVVLARPTRSRTLLVQMIGRGMRLHPGKKDCLILDMVSSFKSGLATTPTLFGLDPDTLVENATSEQMEDATRAEDAKLTHSAPGTLLEPTAAVKSVQFTDYASVTDLLEDFSGEERIWTLSPNAWVQVGSDRYVLSAHSEGHLTLQNQTRPTSDGILSGCVFTVTFTPKLPPRLQYGAIRRGKSVSGGSPYGRNVEIAVCSDLGSAVRAADTFANKNFARQSIWRFQPWRKLPASEAQIEFLAKFYKESESADGEGETLSKSRSRFSRKLPPDLTKGRATDLITKIKFGVRTRYAAIVADKKRHEKSRAKADSDAWMREGQSRITVGPLRTAA